MRYSEIRSGTERLNELSEIERTKGKLTQKLTRERNKLVKQLAVQPIASPPCINTGGEYDTARSGNYVARLNSRGFAGARVLRRNRTGVQPMRSRIQRLARRARTGGWK
jgi:hypothetical protein